MRIRDKGAVGASVALTVMDIRYFLRGINLHLLLVLAVLLISGAVRFHQLGTQSLWNDEGNSYVQSLRSFPDIAANAARDIHPPGYYWLLALWRGAAGESEFGMRMLSALTSVLQIAFVFALGKRLSGGGAGLLAAGFTALNTFNIYYAQEMRMYAQLALLATAAMWAFVGLTARPGWKWAVVFALFTSAGLWTQYSYPLVMLAQGVLVVGLLLYEVSRHRGQRALQLLLWFTVANVAALALYGPWIPTAIQQITTWPNTGQPVSTDEALRTVAGLFTYGLTATTQELNAWAYVFPVIFLLAGLIPLVARRRLPEGWRVLVPVVWVLIGAGLFFAAGLFRPANLKFLLPAQVAVALWMGRGAWLLWEIGSANFFIPLEAAPRIAALVGIYAMLNFFSLGVGQVYSDPALQRADYRTIVRDISDNLSPDEAVILNAPNQEEVFRYYYRADAPVYPLPPGLGGNDDETLQLTRDVIRQHTGVYAVFWGEAERDPHRIVETTLDLEAFPVSDQWYGDVRVARYAMADELTLSGDGAGFGEVISLEQWSLNKAEFRPGEVVLLRLEWRASATPDRRYKVFVQLLNDQGQLVAQRDSEPVGNTRLTTTWTPDEPVTDQHGLLLPYTLASGEYTLIAGLYDGDTGVRLTVGEGDVFTVRSIQVIE